MSLLLAISYMASAQYFCGHIKYKFTYYRTKDSTDITATVNDVKEMDDYICGNKRASYLDGNLQYLYIGDSVTHYWFVGNQTLRYIKADLSYGEKESVFSNSRDSVMVNGKLYKSYDKADKKSITTIYYRDDIKLDTSLYRGYKLYHMDKEYKVNGGAIYLIGVNKEKKITLVTEAVEIDSYPIADKYFAGVLNDHWQEPFVTFGVNGSKERPVWKYRKEAGVK